MAIQSNTFPRHKAPNTLAKRRRVLIAGGFAVALIAANLFLDTNGSTNNIATTVAPVAGDLNAS